MSYEEGLIAKAIQDVAGALSEQKKPKVLVVVVNNPGQMTDEASMKFAQMLKQSIEEALS